MVSKIVFKKEFAKGLDDIEGWSHIYVIFWMNKISDKEKTLVHPGGGRRVGIFATFVVQILPSVLLGVFAPQ